METPFTSSKDNVQGDENDEEIPILMRSARRLYHFRLFALSALFVLSVLFGLIVLVDLLPSRHLFLMFALFSPLALCPYLRRRSPHRDRSQVSFSMDFSVDRSQMETPFTSSEDNLQGSRLGFNTPKSWESWGLPKQMETPFTSSKDNVQGDENDEEISILTRSARRVHHFRLFSIWALYVLSVLFGLIALIGLLPSWHLFLILIFALFSPLALCPYLRRRSPHPGRSQGTSSKDNLQGSRLGFNTPESWESWGLSKQMGTPFTSSKDNVQEPSSSPDCWESSKTNRSPKSTKWALSSICGMHDENNVPGKKKHDPSSCDSNRTPSSEVEKGAGLNKKEVKGVNEQGEQGPSIVQEFRDTLRNIKSCSEGLKQCVQALEELLSRGELTQSLSPPHQDGNWAINSGNEKALGLQFDLNTKASTTTCNISKAKAQSCSKMGSEVATFKRLLVDTEEKNNTGQEGRQ